MLMEVNIMSDEELTDYGLLPEHGPLVRAMGGALSMFATLLSRNGSIETREVADLLGIYAVATSEVDKTEGLILGCWAAMLRDLADATNH
jgi:hypothetical protein